MKEVNPNKEYIFLGDISGSMSNEDCGGQSRFNYMLEKFKLFINQACEFDEHSAADIILFGENIYSFDKAKPEDVDGLLKNVFLEGFTNLHLAIEKSFSMHKQAKREYKKEDKVHPGTVFFVFTDGEPTNRKAVKEQLKRIIEDIDSEDEVQVVMVIVGQPSSELRLWLKSIHDDLEDESINPNDYDILHVTSIDEVNFLECLKLKDHD